MLWELIVKVDLKKVVASYKAKHGQFTIVKVPTMQYLMIDGHKGPASSEFASAIEALYAVAYKLKFMSKLSLKKDYVVPPLEALWWAEDMEVFTTKFNQSMWDWTAMIMVPEWISREMFLDALEEVQAKKKQLSLDKLRLEELSEGICVQTLHLGPYTDEGPVLADMHDNFMPENGLKLHGKHHEIYFNDFRKVVPEKLKTILRQPAIARSA